MRKLFLSGLIAGVVAAMAGPASAGTLYVGPNFTQTLNYKLFDEAKSSGSGSIDHSTLTTGGQTYDLPFLYCLDILTDVNVGNSYPVTITTDGTISSKLAPTDTLPTTHTLLNADKIAWLLQYAWGIASAPDGSRTTAQAESQMGLQAAIWKQVYGDDFEFGSNTAGITTAYNQYIDALAYAYGHGQTGNASSALWLSPGDGQQQALVTVIAPEPGSLNVWGAGFVIAAVAMRRRTTKSPAV